MSCTGLLEWDMASSNEALHAEIAAMRTDIQALTSGLMLMLDVQETHGVLLRELGEALTHEPDGPSPVAEALERLAAVGKDQTEAIERLTQRLAGATLRGVVPLGS